MTHGNQRELAHQKNMKKDSAEMTGFLLPSASRGTRRSCSRSKKRQTRRRRNPSSFVASCPTLLPFACVPGAMLTGPSTNGIPFALSLQRVLFVLPSPQVASLPLGHSPG
uniref:Small EDRK-rich factor-like N-terminal domain-containing protein n=2 Tax=Rhinopithecus TaxID=542827 RepID=A0A2K6LB30_RHIBE